MLLNITKSRNQDIEALLLKENNRLKRENQQLQSHLKELERYKNEYKNLIETVSKLKKDYQNKIAEFDQLESEYKKELNRLFNNITRK